MWLEQGAESGRDWLAARDIRVVRHRESAADIEHRESRIPPVFEQIHQFERVGRRGGTGRDAVELASDVKAESGDVAALGDGLRELLCEIR